MRLGVTVVAFVGALVSRVAHASLPREPPEDCRDRAARLEIAPWVALGGGMRIDDAGQRAIGVLAADAALTLPMISAHRIGWWTTPGTTDFASFDFPAGLRLELNSHELNQSHSDFFGVGGRYTASLDTGVGVRFGADGNRGLFWRTRVAFGFTAPNRLYHLYGAQPVCRCERVDEQEVQDVQDVQEPRPKDCRPAMGEVSGVRPFVALQRAFDASFTEVTFGLSFETIGAGWWIGAGL